jgi:hypothetical protein
MTVLAIRKLADKSTQTRIVRYDPETGEKKLVNPATPGEEHEPWPFAGIEFVGEPPQETFVSIKVINTGVREGWIKKKGQRAVVRPAGKTQDDFNGVQGVPHTFIHCDEIIFKTVHGNVRYRVTQQPDKYAVVDEELVNPEKGLYRQVIDLEKSVTPEIYAAGETRVTNFYRLERVSDNG